MLLVYPLYMGLFRSLMTESEKLGTYETVSNSETGKGGEAALGPGGGTFGH